MAGLMLAVLPAWCFSQITITAEDMPAAGDTVRTSRLLNPMGFPFAPDTTGENIYLDLTGLDPTTQELIEYVPGTQTPYATSFGNLFGSRNSTLDFLSNLPVPGGQGLKIENVYDFYQPGPDTFMITARGLQLNGFPLPTHYTDKDELFQFPLNYQDRDSSTFRYAANIPFVQGGYASSGYRINEADGWGKIKLLTGEYEVLRVKSTVHAQDTLKIPEGILPLTPPPIPFQYIRTEIKWMAKGEKIPVLQINLTQAILPGGQTAPPTTEILYRDINRLPEAAFTTEGELSGCKPLAVTFKNNSVRAQNYVWRFGDGTTSTEPEPTHVYNTGGTMRVTLIAINPYGVDSMFVNGLVKVDKFATDFIAAPTDTFLKDATVKFTNKSIRLIPGQYQFFWDFGDGQTSQEENPTVTYSAVGQYTVQLIGIAPNDCRDTTRRERFITIIEDPIGRPELVSRRLNFALAPNPTTGVSRILLADEPTSEYTAEIYDLNGKRVYQTYFSGAQTELNLPSSLPAGLYTLKLSGKNGLGTLKFNLLR